MPYSPFYPGGWLNLPTTTTPIVAAALQNIETGVVNASFWYNVRAYGALGNGSADDTVAIQAALNAANSAGGGLVYAPKGTYKLSTVTVFNNTMLLGDGPQATIFSCNATPTAVIVTDTSATGCIFENFQINVNQSSGSSSHGLYLLSAPGKPVTLHRVNNVHVYYAGQDGIHVGNSVIESHIFNCFAYGCQKSGFRTEVSATDNKFIGCSAAQSASHGFYIQGNTTHFTSCKSYYSGFINGTSGNLTSNWNDASGFYLGPAATQSLSRIWMDSCEAQNNATNGFFLDGSASTAQIDHVSMVACYSDGDNVKNDGGAGFKFYRVLNTTMSASGVNIGTNSTSSKINYGLAIFSTLTGTQFADLHLEGNLGGIFIDGTATGNYVLPVIQPSGDTTGATDLNTLTAITAAGNVVKLASGTYYVNNTIVAGTGGGLQGVGAGSTIISQNTTGAGYAGSNMIAFTGHRGVVKDCSVIGGSPTFSLNAAANGIIIQSGSNGCVVSNVDINAMNGWGVVVISDATADTFNTTLQNIHTFQCAEGIQLKGTASSDHDQNTQVIGCNTDQCQNSDGLQLIDVHDVQVWGHKGTCTAGTGKAINIIGACAGIFIDASSDLGAPPGTNVAQPIIAVGASGGNSPNNVTLRSGITLGGSPNILIGGAATNIIVDGFQVYQAQTSGIVVNSTATQVTVTNNQIRQSNQGNTTSYDIQFAGTGDGIVRGNILATPQGASAGHVPQAMDIPSSGTVIVDGNFLEGASGTNTFNNFPKKATNNINYNPVGHVTSPGVPLTTVTLANPFGSDAYVSIVSGASTCAVAIGGTTIFTIVTGGGFAGTGNVFLPWNQTITLTYTSAPSWTWFVS